MALSSGNSLASAPGSSGTCTNDLTSLPGTRVISCTGAFAATDESALLYLGHGDSQSLTWAPGTPGASISTTGDFATAVHVSSSTGNVSLSSAGNVSTTGFLSAGLFAYSNFGTVTVTSHGNITTTGEISDGIIADGRAGATLTTHGNVSALGADSYAISAVSLGGIARVNVAGGTVMAPQGLAVAVKGNEAYLENSGTIIGNVRLRGTVAATFDNHAGGTLKSGDSINLGSNGTMRNAGTFQIGSGTGPTVTTNFTGNYVQTHSGRLVVRSDHASGTADRLVVSGTADLAGTLIVDPVFPQSGTGLTRNFTVVTAGGGISSDGLKVANTAAVSYTLARPDSNTLDIVSTVNFSGSAGGAGTAPGRSAVGSALNAIYAGGGKLDFMPALMALSTSGQLSKALDQLAPLGDAAAFSSALRTSTTFGSQLMNCRVAGEDAGNAFARDGQCVWARVGARKANGDGGHAGTGFEERASFVSGGAQVDLGGPWRVGGGFGYETPNVTTDSGARSQGERLHVGGVVKYDRGPWLMAAALTGGQGWHDNTRLVGFTGFAATATSQSKTSFVSGRATGAYLKSFGDWYLKPQVEIANSSLMRGSYTEAGPGGVALALAGASANVWSIAPSLEFGRQLALSRNVIARPFVRAGVTLSDTDTFATAAAFIGAPAGTPGFIVTTRVDRTVADIAAGVDVIGRNDSAFRLQYDGQLGSRTTQHAGSANLNLKF